VDCHRSDGAPSAKPEPHQLALEAQGRDRAPLNSRPVTLRLQRSLGDAHRGDVEHRAEVHGEPCSPGMIPSGRIYEQDVRGLRQGTHRGFQQRSLPEGQKSRLVGRLRLSLDEAMHHCRTLAEKRGRGPGLLPRLARAGRGSKAHEASGYCHARGRRFPGFRTGSPQDLLEFDQPRRARGPEPHTPIF
jgi:hypothetical protein